MNELYELKEKLCKELKEYGNKELSAGSLSTIDSLAHTVKNLDKIIEAYDEGESSMYPYSYDDGMNGRSMRYSRNRSYRGQRRDSMGRYSRDGIADKLRDLMEEAPDEKTRQDIQRIVDRM